MRQEMVSETPSPLNESLKEAFGGYSLRSGFLKLAILKIISERPIHGYALMREIERITDHAWRPSPGSVYPALKEMEAAGLIARSDQGRKRIYSITALGQGTLGQAVDHVQEALGNLSNLLNYRREGA